MATNLTAINTDQLLKGYGARSFYTIEGVVSKFIGTVSDIINTSPDLPLRFIVKNPDGTITSLGGAENDICVVNDDDTYSFIKPKETTSILFLQGTCIYHFKNNTWNNIFRFSQASIIGEVPEAPEDGKGYVRSNKMWEDVRNHFPIQIDAPIDNRLYVRKNGTWSEIAHNPFTTDAPIDNKIYGRKNTYWVEIKAEVPEAPNDGKYYGRRNQNWEIIPNIGDNVIPEAPEDSKIYARKNKNWISIINGFPDVENDNVAYVRRNKEWSSLLSYLPTPPIPNDAPNDGKYYARRNKQWENIINQGVEEAPNDGSSYIRRNKQWISFIDNGILDVPSVNPDKLYLRKYNGWIEYIERNVEEAPNDNVEYVRKNKSWVRNKNVPFETDAPNDGRTYGRKNNQWEEISSGGGAGGSGVLLGAHNTATNIQGGKVENGTVTEAYHLTREEYLRLPYKPIILSPANNSININQIPIIHGSAYQHPFEYSMFGMEVLISKTENFDNVIYTYSGYSNTTSHQVPEKQGGILTLETGTTYWVKIRYQDVNKNWSSYSEPIKFETMIQFPTQILKQPILLNPKNGGIIPRKNPILIMTQPEVNIGTGNFISADWQISDDIGFNNLLYNKTDTSDLTYHSTENVNLVDASGNADFYVRGRQKFSNGEFTNWSNPSRCKIRPEYNNPILGLRRIFDRENERILLQHIDENGDVIHVTSEYLNSSNLFKFSKYITPAINFVNNVNSPNTSYNLEWCWVSPIWMKNNIYNDSSNNLTIDCWFSPYNPSSSGWFLHPAFLLHENGFYITSTPINNYDVIVYNLYNSIYQINYTNNRYSYLINNLTLQNVYHMNLMYYLYMIKNLYLWYSYDISLSISNYINQFLTKFNNFHFLNGDLQIATLGCYYNSLDGKYFLSPPSRISKSVYYGYNSPFIFNDNDYKYNITFNGDKQLSGADRYCKVLDIYTGPLPEYEQFDVALLSLPKEIELEDMSKKSFFKNTFSLKDIVDNYDPLNIKFRNLVFKHSVVPSEIYYNVFLNLFENGLLLPHMGFFRNYTFTNYLVKNTL